MFRIAVVAVALVGTGVSVVAQPDVDRVLEMFSSRVDAYVQLHRRIEGPVSPLQASQELAEVRRLMADVRRRIKSERRLVQGQHFTTEVRRALRTRIATVLTHADVQAMMDDLVEHSPTLLPPVRVNESLPADAPFIGIPPRLFKVLPELPAELRYVILEKGLVLWDHHADLVVDMAPGLLDPRAFRTFKSEN